MNSMNKRSINGQHTDAEIHLNSVKDFYSQNEELFDVAVDAVVKGCVSQYSFDDEAHKFIGTVSSLDGHEMYELEIKVTDTFEIGAAVCNCPEQEICYHIGALALHSGYKTPIFSYHDTNDENDLSECTPKPLQEVYVKCEELDLPSSKEMKPTSHEFLKLGNIYTKCSLTRSAKIALRQFKSSFGISPIICSIVWHELKNDLPPGALPKHLLWCLSFLKQYTNEHKRRSFLNADEKTVRKWTWIFMKLLSDLNVIIWEKRFDGADHGETCFTSLDGVDFKIVEPKSSNKRWFSHKCRSAALRYEVGLNMQNGNIVWAFGGYPCGLFSDLQVAKEKFVHALGADEKTMADKAYKDKNYFILPNDGNRTQHKLVMSRQEVVSKRLKQFKILKKDFRHPLDKHPMVFHAVANLIQLTLQHEEPLF